MLDMTYTPEEERYMRLALEEAEQAYEEGWTCDRPGSQ